MTTEELEGMKAVCMGKCSYFNCQYTDDCPTKSANGKYARDWTDEDIKRLAEEGI